MAAAVNCIGYANVPLRYRCDGCKEQTFARRPDDDKEILIARLKERKPGLVFQWEFPLAWRHWGNPDVGGFAAPPLLEAVGATRNRPSMRSEA